MARMSHRNGAMSSLSPMNEKKGELIDEPTME